MAAKFTTKTKTQLISWIARRVEGGRRPPGCTSTAADGYSWWRTEETVSLYRIGEGITAPYTATANNEVKGNLIEFTGGTGYIQGDANRTYRLTDYQLTQLAEGADIWREDVAYTWIGQWVLGLASDETNNNEEGTVEEE